MYLVVVARQSPVCLGRDHRGFAGRSQRRDDPLVGIERFVGDQRVGLHRGQEVVGADQIMRLSAGQGEVDRVAERIDQGVDFGAQPPALIGRWPRPRRLFLGAGAVLMGTHNGAVDHRIFIVGVSGKLQEDLLPYTRIWPIC